MSLDDLIERWTATAGALLWEVRLDAARHLDPLGRHVLGTVSIDWLDHLVPEGTGEGDRVARMVALRQVALDDYRERFVHEHQSCQPRTCLYCERNRLESAALNAILDTATPEG